jgi:hypothetical protein
MRRMVEMAIQRYGRLDILSLSVDTLQQFLHEAQTYANELGSGAL